jgi:hypothetical protein
MLRGTGDGVPFPLTLELICSASVYVSAANASLPKDRREPRRSVREVCILLSA